MNDALSWHSKHWQVIDSYQAHGKLAHAILLSGRAGLGKSIFAHALAKRILCQASQPPTHAACQPNSPDACASCRLFSSETNPDLLFIKPSPPADQILLEDVLATKDFLQTTSHLGGAKVCVIHEADRMNVNSANAMLKIIEEPPPNKFLLLTSSNSKLLLLTIKSRCVNLNFSPPPAETTLAWLKQNLQEELANLPADALQDDMLFAMNADAPFAIEEMIKSGKAARAVQTAQKLGRRGRAWTSSKTTTKNWSPWKSWTC